MCDSTLQGARLAGRKRRNRNRWRWPGQIVEVRSLQEILETLDANGSVSDLPFMPEMASHAGRRLRVARTATAICVEGHPGLRELRDTVLLEDLRCDGSAHDGCQRGCTILWKTAWLKPSTESGPIHSPETRAAPDALPDLRTKTGDRYYCQSTELADATSPIPRWSLRPLLEDLGRRELKVDRFLRISLLAITDKVLQALRGRGLIPSGKQRRTSRGDLGLQAGDLVRIKDATQIEATLTPDGTNRGLSFEYEMFDRCGQVCSVAYPVRRIILETTGEMVELASSVVLDGMVCEGLRRRNCPRANHFYWREAWLQKVNEPERSG